MIKANELRIGNWIKVKTSNDAGFYQVDEINEYVRNWGTKKKGESFVDERVIKIVGGARNGEQHVESNLRPISITPEILEKCGFIEECPHYMGLYGYRDLFLDECLVRIGSETTVFIKRTESDKIKYLHQLQNLYFALTGNELEVNL